MTCIGWKYVSPLKDIDILFIGTRQGCKKWNQPLKDWPLPRIEHWPISLVAIHLVYDVIFHNMKYRDMLIGFHARGWKLFDIKVFFLFFFFSNFEKEFQNFIEKSWCILYWILYWIRISTRASAVTRDYKSPQTVAETKKKKKNKDRGDTEKRDTSKVAGNGWVDSTRVGSIFALTKWWAGAVFYDHVWCLGQ